MRNLVVAVLGFVLLSLSAQAAIDFNDNCKAAYKRITAFAIPEARLLIAKEKRHNPQNTAVLYLENTADFFSIFATENPKDFQRMESRKEERIALLEKESANSPYRDFMIAEMHMQWALTRFKFQEYVSGALEVNKAFGLLEQNKKRFPDFIATNKSLGLIHIMLSMAPPSLQKALSIVGLKGDPDYGLKLVQELLKETNTGSCAWLYDEMVFYYYYVSVEYLREPNSYERMIELSQKMSDNSLLKTYLTASLYMKNARTAQAIVALQNRPSGPNFQPFYHLDYLLGLCKLNRQDEDVDQAFKKYITTYPGVFYIKDAWLRTGWFYLLKGNVKEYRACMEKVKTQGYDLSEKDKQSLKDAEAETIPNLFLLSARLWYDGGYYEKALNVLKEKKAESFSNKYEQLEFNYRLGRIYQSRQELDKAIQHYASVISQGMDSKVYYVPNAALQLGIIFEKRGNKEKAEYYYKLCLNRKGHEYKNSLDSKAKAGLERLK